MSGSFVLIAVVISVIAIAVVTAPLRGKQQQASPAKRRPEPGSEYENTLLAIRDLDFDHELGVVAKDDYQRLREDLVARAAESMPRKKGRAKKSAKGPKKAGVHTKRRAASNEEVATIAEDGGSECPECGRPHRPDHVFCGKCGARLSAA